MKRVTRYRLAIAVAVLAAGHGRPAAQAQTTRPAGFFRTELTDGRWWLIDPQGRPFYAVGTDHCRFEGHWCEALGCHPYEQNMRSKYGDPRRWADVNAARLIDWGFNALAAGHTPALRRPGLAHIDDLHLGAAFAAKDALCPRTFWTGFPNVFSPDWPKHCDRVARERCAPQKGDAQLIGYFLDNELEWYGKSGREWGLFDEAWKLPPDHTAKQEWVAWVRRELKDPAAFAKHWGVAITDFADLAVNTKPAQPRTDHAREVAAGWVREVADRYFRECAAAIRRHDPNHLVLGCRFAGQAPGVWEIAGRYCDVVSFNTYPTIDVERGVPGYVIERYEDWHRRCGKPMMVTEWSFPALDAGLPSTNGAGMRVDTQEQRARCFMHFQSLMFRLPFVVGSNYFMWVDEPAQGISKAFPENSNYGLVNEHDEPYAPLVEAAKRLNPRAVELHRAGGVSRRDPGDWLVPWLRDTPSDVRPVPGGPLKLTSGRLTVAGPHGGEAWRLSAGDTCLANLFPAIRQATRPPQWRAPDSARIVSIRQDVRVTVVDMEFAYGGAAPASSAPVLPDGPEPPRRCRCACRYWVPAGPPGAAGPRAGWIAARHLWVENTDSSAWTLEMVFHCLMPAIGGSSADDEPLSFPATPYYRRGGAWIDRTVGQGVACWFPADPDFWIRYWKDETGACHPDLYRTVGRSLAPGRRIEIEPAVAFFFPLDRPACERFVELSGEVEREAMVRP